MSSIFVFYNNEENNHTKLHPIKNNDSNDHKNPNSCYFLVEKAYGVSDLSIWTNALFSSRFYFLSNIITRDQAEIIDRLIPTVFKTVEIYGTDNFAVLTHMRPSSDYMKTVDFSSMDISEKAKYHFSPTFNIFKRENQELSSINRPSLVKNGESNILNFLSTIIVPEKGLEPIILNQTGFTYLSLKPGEMWAMHRNISKYSPLPQKDTLFTDDVYYKERANDGRYTEHVSSEGKITLTFQQDVTLDAIYNAIVHTVAYHQECLGMFFKYNFPNNSVYVNQKQTNTLEIIEDHVRIVLENDAKILPGKIMSNLKYNFWKGLNISPDVNIEFQNKVLLRYMSSAKFNALVKIYEDKECTVQLGTVYQTETTSLNFHVPRNGGFKIAAWSLGNASYYGSNQNIAVTSGSTTSIPWNPYANDVLNLNAINSVLPIMNTINSVVTPTGIELQLPAIRLNSDEAKMALHLLSSSREGLEASMSGDGEYISRINTDRFTIFAPSFTVVKQSNLRADQEVYIDLYIDTINAVKLNPEYVVNPYRANGRVELPAAPAITRNPAQEIVDTLLRHPQFVSNTTMTLALDK